MNLLRASIVTALALSVTLASAQGASPSIEERLRQLEAEQAAMKQQLAERDAVIEELKRELQAQGAVAVQAPTPPTGAPARRRRLRLPSWPPAPPSRGSSSRDVAHAHAADGRDLGRLRPG